MLLHFENGSLYIVNANFVVFEKRYGSSLLFQFSKASAKSEGRGIEVLGAVPVEMERSRACF